MFMNKEFSTEHKFVHIKEIVDQSLLFSKDTEGENNELADLFAPSPESFVNKKTGKINAKGKIFAEFIMHHENPELLDVLLNADQNNPFSPQQRTELIRTYIRTLFAYTFPNGRGSESFAGLTDAEVLAIERSLRARNLFRINKIRVGEHKLFEAVEPEQLAKDGLAKKVRAIFQKDTLTKVPTERDYSQDAAKFFYPVSGPIELGETLDSAIVLMTTARRIGFKAVMVAGALTVLFGVTGVLYGINPSLGRSLVAAVTGVEKAQARGVQNNEIDDLYMQMTATAGGDARSSDAKEKDDSISQESSREEEARLTDAYSFVKVTLLTNLLSLQRAIEARGELTEQDMAMLAGIENTREKLINNDEIIVNLVVTDRTGSPDKPYFKEGQEHVGNSDAFMQLVLNKQGFHIISFGRDLQVPRMAPQPDGSFIENDSVPIHMLGGPLTTADGKYIIAPDGAMITGLDEGRQEAVFNEVTGQEALLNIRMSVGLLNQLFKAALPDGVELTFPNGFTSQYVNHLPGSTVKLSGIELSKALQQRPEGSNERGLSFLKALAADPMNYVRLVQALDLRGPFTLLASQDLGPADGRELTVGTSPEDLATWQALKMAMENENFASNVLGLLMNDIVGMVTSGEFEVPMYTIDAPGGGYSMPIVDYRAQVDEIMDHISADETP
jgi:hypothetical protein